MATCGVMTRHKDGIITSDTQAPGGNGGTFINAKLLDSPLPSSPIVDDIHTIWNTQKFLNPRKPISVGKVKNNPAFSNTPVVSVTDMPIKFPGSEYRVPVELTQFSDTIQTCANFEHRANKFINMYYAYLTIDQRQVRKGEYQRGKGLHSDSVQGRRIWPKTYIEHTYLCVDRDPTLFYAQPFDLTEYDVDRHWFNLIFEEQAKHQNAVHGEPYEIMLLDAYTIHGAVASSADGVRTLLRLIYSVRKFDRLGNTHNDLFDYAWKMQPRPLPADLIGLSAK